MDNGKLTLNLGGSSFPAEYEEPKKNSYGIFILRRNASGHYVADDKLHPLLPLVACDEKFEGSGINAHLYIVRELTHFLGTRNSESTNVSSYEYREVAEALRGDWTPFLFAELHRIANASTDPFPRLLAIEQLFERNDFTDQNKVIPLVLKPLSYDVNLYGHGNWNPSVADGAYLQRLPAIRKWFLEKQGRIDMLIDGLKSTYAGERTQAACALSQLGNNPAITKALATAVADEDSNVAYFANEGLTAATGLSTDDRTSFSPRSGLAAEFWKKWASIPKSFGSPLAVPKLTDPRPHYDYTEDITFAFPPSDWPNLVHTSDLIVVGELKPSEITSKEKTCQIVVQSVLKKRGEHNLDKIFTTIEYGAAHTSGIFFLNRQSDGLYEFPDGLYVHSMVDVDGNKSSNDIGADESSIIQNMIDRLLDVLCTAPVDLHPSPRIEVPRNDVAAASADGHIITTQRAEKKLNASVKDVTYNEASESLESLPAQRVVSKLKERLTRPLSDVSKLWITKTLVSLDDYDAVETFRDMLLKNKELSEETDCALRQLVHSIENVGYQPDEKKNVDKRASIMIALLKSEKVEVRRAAAANLARIASMPKIKDKVALALIPTLYDPDMDVRWQGISALEYATDRHVRLPRTYEEFVANQAHVVERMRSWAKLQDQFSAAAQRMEEPGANLKNLSSRSQTMPIAYAILIGAAALLCLLVIRSRFKK